MKPTVYLETSVISYLTARPSRDLLTWTRQLMTQQWWETAAPNCDLFTSAAVLDEVSKGDPVKAQERRAALTGVMLLDPTTEAERLYLVLLRVGAFPPKSRYDALHLAIAAVHGMNFVLSWNFKHLSGQQVRRRIEDACRLEGYNPPIITTP